jgi:ABC-2 type transport system ATP-binding protein
MHEADQLCREIAIVDRGLIVAQGTPQELKERVGGSRRVVISTQQPLNGQLPDVERELNGLAGVQGVISDLDDAGGGRLTLLCTETAQALDSALALLRQTHAVISQVQVIEPTLEDVFLSVAGRSFE